MSVGGANRPAASRIPAVAALLAGSVLLSRLLGYVREMVLAYHLGAGAEADAYRAAFQLPDLLNYFLAGGALSIAFVPFYTRVRERAGEGAAETLLAKILGTMTLLAVLATGALWWWAEPLVGFQFRGFAPETLELTTRLTRIVLPAQIFFVAGGIIRAALMANDRFATQALAPLLYNGGIILGGVLFGATLGAEGFAWGALGGACVGPFLVPWIDARRGAGLRLRARVALLDREFWSYLAVAAPLMLGMTLLTVDEWYERWFGALLEEGTVARLAYARQLMLLPVAVVGQAVATAALPALSQLWSRGRPRELDAVLLRTLRAALGLACLGAVAAAVLAEPLVAVLFERGRFGPEDTARVASLLRILAWAVPAWVAQQIATRGFFARGDTWRPMLLGTGISVAAVPLYLALGRELGGEGLALAGVVAMSASTLATLAWLRRVHGGPELGPLLPCLARGLAVAGCAGLAAQLVVARLPGPPLGALLAGGAVFGSVAIPASWAFGDDLLRETLRRLGARLRGRLRG